MFEKIKKILTENYHRPTAKLHHICTLFLKLLFNKKTNIFSEKVMLLKKPPNSTIYYNFFGRAIFMLLNFIWVIIFNKFFEKETYIDDNSKSKNFDELYKKGNNEIPWPIQAIHVYEKTKEVDEVFLNQINKDYFESVDIVQTNQIFEDTEWWKSCRDEFKKLFIKNKNINLTAIENFRNNVKTKAEILNYHNFLNTNNSKKINKIKSILLINLYHKLSTNICLEVLRTTSDSIIGNNLCLNYRGQRINQRTLRYAYYLSQIKLNTSLESDNRNLFLDVGGGYGGLSRLISNYYHNSTCVIIELPELCLLSSYFLKSNYPDKKVATYNDFKNTSQVSAESLMKYDYVILPQFFMEKFNDDIFDLTINTTSLSEISSTMQSYYLKHIERCTSKFFYSVNRAEKRLEKYNSQGFYNFKFKKRWKSVLYKFTHTYHIEFLGKKLNYKNNLNKNN